MNQSDVAHYAYRPLFRRLVDGFGTITSRFGANHGVYEPEALKASAIRQTGFDDFGAPDVDEPLGLLCDDYSRASHLTFAGHLAAKHHLQQLLSNRLKLQACAQRHPEISQQQIKKPVFVLGLPRSGTTLLHGLLAQDRRHRCPMTWEVMFPDPPPEAAGFETDKRIKLTDGKLGWLDHLAPGFKTIHPIGATLPQECIAITANALISLEFHTTNHVPTYQTWYEKHDLRSAYRYHLAFLQHLQWKHARERWVLKAPDHLRGLDALLTVYPDATVIQTHRNPLKVAASISSHGTVLRAGFSDHIDPAKIAAEWNEYWANSLDRAMAARARHVNTTFVDVYYEDLVTNPIECIAKLYQTLSLSFDDDTRSRMTNFLAANPQDKHGRHRYSLSEFGLHEHAVLERFQSYIKQFDLTDSD